MFAHDGRHASTGVALLVVVNYAVQLLQSNLEFVLDCLRLEFFMRFYVRFLRNVDRQWARHRPRWYTGVVCTMQVIKCLQGTQSSSRFSLVARHVVFLARGRIHISG